MDRDQWPQLFWPLFDRYGGRAVYEIGLDVLGFPPTWAFPSVDQVLQVKNHLSHKKFSERK